MATPAATLSRLNVSFRAPRSTALRGTYILSGLASHDGTLRVTFVVRAKATAAKTAAAKTRKATTTVLTFSVRKGPFTISTAALPKGATLSIVYTPTNSAIAPIVTTPTVQRVIVGTQTHIASKPVAKR